MYLTHKSELPRLRAYYRELGDRYVDAMRHHDLATAHDLFERRRRVLRAVLLREEWCDLPVPESVLNLGG